MSTILERREWLERTAVRNVYEDGATEKLRLRERSNERFRENATADGLVRTPDLSMDNRCAYQRLSSMCTARLPPPSPHKPTLTYELLMLSTAKWDDDTDSIASRAPH
jgi:hypothetical protein